MVIYTYDTLEEGQAIEPVEHQITEEMVRGYIEATGDTPPPGENRSGLDDRGGGAGLAVPQVPVAPQVLVAPPGLVTVFTTALLEKSASGGPSGGIHAKQEYEFLAPIRVGARIVTSATVAEKYLRNGRRTIVMAARSIDEQGVEVARCRVTTILPG